MRWNPSPTELTSGATDLLLVLAAGIALFRLGRLRAADPWKVMLWSWVFGLLGVAALLGAAIHLLALRDAVVSLLWIPTYLALGFTVALFAAAAVHDWRGLRASRRALPFLLLVALAFFAATRAGGGSFLIFVAYELVAMVGALGLYVFLALPPRRLPGAVPVATGIALTILASAIQATKAVRFTFVWPFDHTGAFHLVQIVAVGVLMVGVERGLVSRGSGERGSGGR